MLELVLEVLPLALAGAISPVVLLVALALLSGPRPKLQTGAFAAGVGATIVVLFALGLVAIRLQSDGDEPGWLGSQGAHLVVGMLLIAAGIGLALIRPNPHRVEELEARLLAGHRPARDFALAGVAVMITNASSFVMIIAIIHAVARHAVGVPGDELAFLIAALIVALPATLPFGAAVLGGEARRARLARIGDVATRYGRFAMAAIWIAFGTADVLEVVL